MEATFCLTCGAPLLADVNVCRDCTTLRVALPPGIGAADCAAVDAADTTGFVEREPGEPPTGGGVGGGEHVSQ